MATGSDTFGGRFEALTAHRPFPWQERLFELFISNGKNNIPAVVCIPTGLGKTSVIVIWLLALIERPDQLPRRLVYVVNRRTVVDQTTTEVMSLQHRLSAPAEHAVKSEHVPTLESMTAKLTDMSSTASGPPLAISTLRGQFADNAEWSADPSRPAVICGTVDMIGSRLLFGGYRIGFKSRPLHAGFLGQDALLVHDEAHLEPAFQQLIEAIKHEQHVRERTADLPWARLQVMQLTATARIGPTHRDHEIQVHNEKPFELTDEEQHPPETIPDPEDGERSIVNVWRRLKAQKRLTLTPVEEEKATPIKIAEVAATYKDQRAAVLVFARTVRAVTTIRKELRKTRRRVELLTGTIRGKERDELVDKPEFGRFLQHSAGGETVFLIATSAGEVGVDMSADHMISDLPTLDSMAQRLGRANRFGVDGNGKAMVSRVHVVYPTKFDDRDRLTSARQATLAILERLPELEPGVHNASPNALGRLLGTLTDDERRAAFAPEPIIPCATDILFDAWAFTTIKGNMPGRPEISSYLHGIAEWEPPRTSVAWRQEVAIIGDDLVQRSDELSPQELLDDYPLKPHELLNDVSDRVQRELEILAKRLGDNDCPVWIVDHRNEVDRTTLRNLLAGAKKQVLARIGGRTLLLPPSAGGLSSGMLDGPSKGADDVADLWLDERERARRQREFGDEAQPTDGPDGMALIRTIDIEPETDGPEPGDEVQPSDGSTNIVGQRRRFWHWYVRPRDTEDATRASVRPVLWDDHTNDVVQRTTQIVRTLDLPDTLQHAVILAAELHDLGKRRALWQRSIGNPHPDGPPWYAKSGKPQGPRWRLRRLTKYRHEFGSLLDALDPLQEYSKRFEALSDEMRDVVLHLIAAHHGYARPHFPVDCTVDPNHRRGVSEDAATEVMRRYARLQRRFGRWGLGYLESLLRAADRAASANPTGHGGDDDTQ